MQRVKFFAFLTIAMASAGTLFFVSALKPASTGAYLLLTGWLLLPYVAMMTALAILQKKGKAAVHIYVIAMMTSAGGILFLADVISWRPDAQGALAVLMTPILQSILLTLAHFGTWLSTRGERSCRIHGRRSVQSRADASPEPHERPLHR